jgi:xanthine dehydrogenase YagT iron-sulfur-binding subunit
MKARDHELTRRGFLEYTAMGAVSAGTLEAQQASSTLAPVTACTLTVNGALHDLRLDPRTTLLDLLREHLHLTGTKKGCDHGQCGACTVMVNGARINSCLALAVGHDGDRIVTVEGLAQNGQLHPMQAQFIEQDGFQCGFCTSGQLCSAIAMLGEARAGMPSAVTANLSPAVPVDLTAAEIRERMAGNICRCGAYPNIVAAIQTVHGLGG